MLLLLSPTVADRCRGWIGFDADFAGSDITNLQIVGTDNATKDLFCCNSCANHNGCEFWVRDLETTCYLKRGFKGFQYNRPRRGNFVNSSCRVEVDPTNVTHRISPLMSGCHSDAGYAHEPRGLFAEMLYPNAFEPIPDGAVVRAPKYMCTWSGKEQDLAGDTYHVVGVYGNTEEERDAMCCAACDCSAGCEAWSRRILQGDGIPFGGWRCELKRNLFDPPQRPAKGIRSNFKNASKGTCAFSNSWYPRGGARLVLGGPAYGLEFAPSPAFPPPPPQPAWELFPGYACGGRTHFGFTPNVPTFKVRDRHHSTRTHACTHTHTHTHTPIKMCTSPPYRRARPSAPTPPNVSSSNGRGTRTTGVHYMTQATPPRLV